MSTLYNTLTNNDGDLKFGGNSSIAKKAASKFIPDNNWTITDITVRIDKDTGSPSGNVIISIIGDSSGTPNTSDVKGTVTIANASVSGSYSNINAVFSSSFNLTNGTSYWVLYDVSGGNSDSAYFAARYAASGTMSRYDTSWTNATGNTAISIQGSITAAGPANVKTLNGISAASIKTWNGISWGSIKTWNGIT